MNAKRIGAVLAAALLIVVALLVRSAIQDNSSDSSSPGTDGGVNGSTFTLICSTEFAKICDGLGSKYDVTVEPAGDTLDRLAKADAQDLPDAWLTLDPFPQMLDQIRDRSAPQLPKVVTAAPSLAITYPNLAATKQRAAVLQAACTDPYIAACIVDKAGTKFTDLGSDTDLGTVIPSMVDPVREATGLVWFTTFIAEHFKGADLTTSPWQDNPGTFNAWFKNLRNNVVIADPGTSPIDTMLLRPKLNVAASSSAEAALVIDKHPDVAIILPFTVITMTAQLATFGRTDTALQTKLTTSLHTALQWSDPVPNAQPQSESTFIALRQLWKDAK